MEFVRGHAAVTAAATSIVVFNGVAMPTDLDDETLDVTAARLGHQLVLEASAQLVELHHRVLAVLGEDGASLEGRLRLLHGEIKEIQFKYCIVSIISNCFHYLK